jgi:Ca2+-binding EF-hand superfamily protein
LCNAIWYGLSIGYDFCDHLRKYSSFRTGSKIDKSTFTELLLGIGLLIPEAAIAIIFINYGLENCKILDTTKFCTELEEGEVEDPIARLRSIPITPFKEKSDAITAEILHNYDDKMMDALLHAFENFDKSGTGKVNIVELERLMRCLSLRPSQDSLDTLMVKLDRKATGSFDYSDVKEHLIPFIRSMYKENVKGSLPKCKQAFDLLDKNGDGTLQPSEFRHVVSSHIGDVSNKELDALMEYLDVDHNGAVDWQEFARMYSLTTDEQAMAALDIDLRKVMRKIQYSNLPDPYKYINMFIGLPVTYRASTLAEVSSQESFRSLDKAVCTTQFSDAERGPDTDISFEFQILKCIGVPSEDESRRADVHSRSIRFNLCYTDNAPTADEPGSPPIFLGNCTKLHATVHPSYMDKWIFADKDSLDPDVSCFATCSTAGLDTALLNATKSTPSLEKLYIFVELVSTIKVRPSHVIRLKRPKLVDKDEEDSPIRRRSLDVEDDLPDLKPAGEFPDDGPDQVPLPLVELCAGWTMIPAAALLRGLSQKLEFKMSGGTPFSAVNIKQADLAPRAGMWNALKRTLGYGITSVLTFVINPRNFNKAPVTSLFQTLPPNIVIPSSSVSMVAIYRKLLKEAHMHQLSLSGGLKHHAADPIFSSFPRILNDPAASRVMLYLWSKEGPTDMIRAAGMKCLAEGEVTAQALQIFRHIVLRVYRAFNSPDAQRSRLVMEETLEGINTREAVIRDLVGLTSTGASVTNLGGVSTSTFAVNTSTLSKSKSGVSLLSKSGDLTTLLNSTDRIHSSLQEHTHTPFNARELMWRSSSGAFSAKGDI